MLLIGQLKAVQLGHTSLRDASALLSTALPTRLSSTHSSLSTAASAPPFVLPAPAVGADSQRPKQFLLIRGYRFKEIAVDVRHHVHTTVGYF